MFRLGTLSLLAFTLILSAAIITANPPDDPDSRFNKALAVQTAIARARILLAEKNAQKAVDILEEQLPKVNGNSEYLTLLRDAYRTHVRDLCLAGQPEQARRYLDRLCILDPNAANDPMLRPAVDAPPHKFEQDAAKSKSPWPSVGRFLPNPFAKKEETKAPAAVVRGVPASIVADDDPFDQKNRRENPLDSNKQALARDLLTRGGAEFKNERYTQARICFEQAYQTEPSSLDACRDQWAYCILKSVEEAMAQPGALPARLSELQKQVDGAIAMAPTKMFATGQQLHSQLEQRSKEPAPQVTASISKVRHWGANAEGWQVAETTHFRIFHKQNTDVAERMAQIADNTRVTMYRKWFGHDGGDWQPKCEVVVHSNATAYTQATGVPANSPGHSRIMNEAGRVIARRMDMRLDAAAMMDTVLPHETTHIVLAGMFGVDHVPRWCDEGIAVLSEPNEKIDKHRRNLLKHHRDGQLFGLKELMEFKDAKNDDYPPPRRIGAFYAQSVVLTEFLTQQKNPRVLTEFIKDGVRHGYDQALQKHYNMTFTQLEQLWQQQVLNDVTRFAAQK